jgi:hypothetical protein
VAQHTLIHPVRCKKIYTDDGDKTRGGKHIYSRCFDGVSLLQSLQDLEKYQKKKYSGLNVALDNCNTPISNFISVRARYVIRLKNGK